MRRETGGSINSGSLTSGLPPLTSSLIGDQRGPPYSVLSQETLMTTIAEDVRTQIASLLAKGVLAHWQRMKRSEVPPIARKDDAVVSPRLSRRGRTRRVIRRPVSEVGV